MIFRLKHRIKLVNVMRHMPWQAQLGYNKGVKAATRAQWRSAGMGGLELSYATNVVCLHLYPGKEPDVGNCFNTAKAAIDALVAEGLWTDDTPEHVRTLTFLAPFFVEREEEGIVLSFARSIENACCQVEDWLDKEFEWEDCSSHD